MKVYIGNYPKWIGPYQIAKVFPKFTRSYIEECTWLDKLCNYIYSKRKRVVYVQVDYSDVWNVDNTLSHLIVPVLQKYKATTKSYGEVDEPDMPKDIEPNSEAAYNWALDEMIFAFKSDTFNWVEQFECGEMDIEIAEKEVVPGKRHTYKINQEAVDAYQQRIIRGRMLFAKYYTQLWS